MDIQKCIIIVIVNVNFLYDHEWVIEWSKMFDSRLNVGIGKSNGMQVFHSLICTDETLVTSICKQPST